MLAVREVEVFYGESRALNGVTLGVADGQVDSEIVLAQKIFCVNALARAGIEYVSARSKRSGEA